MEKIKLTPEQLAQYKAIVDSIEKAPFTHRGGEGETRKGHNGEAIP